jgi:hypothetical protein
VLIPSFFFHKNCRLVPNFSKSLKVVAQACDSWQSMTVNQTLIISLVICPLLWTTAARRRVFYCWTLSRGRSLLLHLAAHHFPGKIRLKNDWLGIYAHESGFKQRKVRYYWPWGD